jgi:hypothetical protein
MKFAKKDRVVKGKRMMPSFKNPVEKARWILQHSNVRPRMRFCTNFTKTEAKRNRMKKLAKQLLATRLDPWMGRVETSVEHYEDFRKLARMVLR